MSKTAAFARRRTFVAEGRFGWPGVVPRASALAAAGWPHSRLSFSLSVRAAVLEVRRFSPLRSPLSPVGHPPVLGSLLR